MVIIGEREFVASLAYIESIGNKGLSGFTMTLSRRTTAATFCAFVPPSASPTPTGPADSVEIIALGPHRRSEKYANKSPNERAYREIARISSQQVLPSKERQFAHEEALNLENGA
jgi:hypothetical protein